LAPPMAASTMASSRFELGSSRPLDSPAAAPGAAAGARVILVPSTDDFRERATTLPADELAGGSPSPALALDIGSAYGHTTDILARSLGKYGSAVVGIDVGWKFVDEARKRWPGRRFERLDVLEDQQFVLQLVASHRISLPTPSSHCSAVAQATSAHPAMVPPTQALYTPEQLAQQRRHAESQSQQTADRAKKSKAKTTTTPPPPPVAAAQKLTGRHATTSEGEADALDCPVCGRRWFASDYQAGVVGAREALAQHQRDLHPAEGPALHSLPPPLPAQAAETAEDTAEPTPTPTAIGSGDGAEEEAAAAAASRRATVHGYTCTVCQQFRPLGDFSKNQRRGKKSAIQCRECNASVRAARRRAAAPPQLPPPPPPPAGDGEAPVSAAAAAAASQSHRLRGEGRTTGIAARERPTSAAAPVPPEPEPEPGVAAAPAEAGAAGCGPSSATAEQVGRVASASASGGLWVFVDIGGVRELAALVRVLPFVTQELGASLVVVKSKRLCATAEEHLAAPAQDGGRFWERVLATAAQEGVMGRSKERRGGRPTPRYPLKLPPRYMPGSGLEICRFHNYSQAGCIRGAEGRCPLEHGYHLRVTSIRIGILHCLRFTYVFEKRPAE
jgi:hypothetical protein